MSWLPKQDDFRNFCLSDEAEKGRQRLEEVIIVTVGNSRNILIPYKLCHSIKY